MIRALWCEVTGHDWRTTRITWFEATDPTEPLWRFRSHRGPMQCARCGRRAPTSTAVAIPIAAGWSGVVIIDSVQVSLDPRPTGTT